MEIVMRPVSEPWEGEFHQPADGSGTPGVGLLVLSGSSGRIERERARVFAEQGVNTLTIRWFGGPGQPDGVDGVPLETFTAAVDLLRDEGARRIGILGVSKGAEAWPLILEVLRGAERNS